MTNQEILSKLNSVALFLSAHPDNESNSEMNDRLNDICNVIEFLNPQEIGSTDKKEGFSGFKDINGNDIYEGDEIGLIAKNDTAPFDHAKVLKNGNLECVVTRLDYILTLKEYHEAGYKFILTKP